jgi:hypothetical protein
MLVTIFIVDAGCMATVARCCHGGAACRKGSATAASASAPTPALASALRTVSGSASSGRPVAAKAAQASTQATTGVRHLSIGPLWRAPRCA